MVFLSQKSVKMGAENFICIFTNLAIKGKKEKIKQGREDFFFNFSYPNHRFRRL